MWLYAAFVGAVPVGSPPERFHHIPFEYNGRLLRTTNHEPRFFPRAEGYSRRCRHSESVAAKRHLTPRRLAACELRPAGPSAPKFDERRTTYDERLFAWLSGPCYFTKKSQKKIVSLCKWFYNKMYLKCIKSINIECGLMTWWWLEDGYIRLYFTFLYAIIR